MLYDLCDKPDAMSSDETIGGFLRHLFGAAAPVPEAARIGPDKVVTPDGSRCVQCGACSFSCPIGIQVRDFARHGQCVDDPRCVQCGQCVEVCPRGTLRWAPHPQPRRQELLALEAQLLADGIILEQGVGTSYNKELTAGDQRERA